MKDVETNKVNSNRVLKFRAWDGKQMRHDIFGVMNELFHLAMHNAGAPHHKTNWIFMQYTGLKDKNGKEIYEGDVVLATDIERLKYKIDFDDGCYYFIRPHNGDELTQTNIKNWQIEIIGNIYQKPELLNP